MSGRLFVWGLIYFLAVGLSAWIIGAVNKGTQCEARGGHLVTEYVYNGSLTLCVSSDVRILE